MPLPDFNITGDLPEGIYRVSLEEVRERFGAGSSQRQQVAERVRRIYTLTKSTGHLARFIIFGSFITDKSSPNDADVFLLMENTFDVSQVTGEAAIVFDHPAAQSYFGASIFWVRKLAALGGEDATVAHWQIKRDGNRRGIVEVV